MFKAVEYIKERLKEKSTWVGITGSVTAAAALAVPYSYIVIAIGVIMALTPETGSV